MKLIVVKGLPASGKTTWSRKWVNEAPKERVRVNRDDIRSMLGPYWIPQREDLVTEIENAMIKSSLVEGFSVVVDATNLKGKERFEQLVRELKNSYKNMPYLEAPEVEIAVQDLTDVSLQECLKRDRQREDPVGDDVIMRMYRKYLKKD